MAKGKDHKSYEYGTKASIVSTYTNGIIVGVCAHDINQHDSKTLEAALAHAHTNRTTTIEEAVCDRGYRGNKCPRASNLATPRICIWPVDALSFGHLTHALFGQQIDKNAWLSYH